MLEGHPDVTPSTRVQDAEALFKARARETFPLGDSQPCLRFENTRRASFRCAIAKRSG